MEWAKGFEDWAASPQRKYTGVPPGHLGCNFIESALFTTPWKASYMYMIHFGLQYYYLTFANISTKNCSNVTNCIIQFIMFHLSININLIIIRLTYIKCRESMICPCMICTWLAQTHRNLHCPTNCKIDIWSNQKIFMKFQCA